MSRGLFVKGFPIPSVNGSYRLLNDSLVGLQQIWNSSDDLYRLRSRQLDTRYVLTSDAVFDQNKTYYLLVNGAFVVDQTNHDRAEEIPANTYYEQTIVYQWEIVFLSDGSTSATSSNNVIYAAETVDITTVPSDTSLVWKDSDGVTIITASIVEWSESSFVTVVSDPIVDEAAGTITTTKTTTNLVTGDVTKETEIVKKRESYVTTDLVRCDYGAPAVGSVYRFSFVADFEKIGYIDGGSDQAQNAGVFKLEKIFSYFDLVTSGIDLYANLYQPLAIKKEVYLHDQERLATSMVYKLIDPTDNNIVIYMPQIFIKNVDPSVEQCNKYLLTVDLGVQSENTLFELEELLSSILKQKYGIKSESDTESIVSLTVYDKVWLTTSTIKAIQDTRDEIKKLAPSVGDVGLMTLQDTNQYLKENRRLRHMVASLEAVIEKLNSKQ